MWADARESVTGPLTEIFNSGGYGVPLTADEARWWRADRG